MLRKVALASLHFITIESNPEEESEFNRWASFPPRYDWRALDTDEYENISGKLKNARNVRMPDIESGLITEGDHCGFYGCNDYNGTPFQTNPFGPQNAIDGNTHNQGALYQNFHNKPFREKFAAGSEFDGQNSGMFQGYAPWYRTQNPRIMDNAWVADIEDSPTVEYIKIWPAFNWIEPFFYVGAVGLRVTINNVECNPIEYYDINRVRSFLPWYSVPNSMSFVGQDRTFADYGSEAAYFFKCDTPIQNANSIKIKHDAGILAFNEVEIFSLKPTDPCESNPCNADQTNAHVCRVEADSYKCLCANGFYGNNCEFARQCAGKTCNGWGDVHYTTFDSTVHDNQGFCQYVLTTNAACGANWPIDADNFDWLNAYDTVPDGQDFFMVIANHDAIPRYGYNTELSRLTGIQVVFSPAKGAVWRLTSGPNGWKFQVWRDYYGWMKRTCGSACSWTNAAGNFIGSWNRPDAKMAMRVNGGETEIYVGAGTRNGDTSWYARNNSPVRDYLLKVRFGWTTYSSGDYGYVYVNANCELDNDVCGICGDYDGQPDFNQANNYDNFGNKRVWERNLEKTHYWNYPWLSEGEFYQGTSFQGNPKFVDDAQCPYNNQDGNPVPNQELAARHNGRKKRQLSIDCPCTVY